MLQLVDRQHVRKEDRQYLDQMMLGAVELANETLLLLGQADPPPSVSRLTAEWIIESIFQAHELVASSA